MKKLDYVMAAVKTLVVKQWHGKKTASNEFTILIRHKKKPFSPLCLGPNCSKRNESSLPMFRFTHAVPDILSVQSANIMVGHYIYIYI